jgi:hypothetical protein
MLRRFIKNEKKTNYVCKYQQIADRSANHLYTASGRCIAQRNIGTFLDMPGAHPDFLCAGPDIRFVYRSVRVI